ncbi:TonB-dependent receptor plug domain-containing protein [Alteromonas sp. AO-Serp]|uniref:TonB-dependent receptor plug domain-containing protein n=1 Tax=Alteromonas sp. AO-Serp TaxID=2804349 RepID=UPI00257F7233|nr:TonB-dependent receptor plug domain-containing protein [Alteromonas sp. AO-Serp]
MFKNQQHKLTRSVRLAIAMGALTSISAPIAVAQEAGETEIIEVTGIRGSQKANINAKRFSNAIVDAITAEDIGKFPDKNVAETLARVPGITIDRDFGEGQGVTTRRSARPKLDPSERSSRGNRSVVCVIRRNP